MHILYARVSTAEQGESGWSLQAQLEIIRPPAPADEIEIFKDISSGSNTRRPGLQNLLQYVKRCSLKAPEGGTVHVWRPDRLSRSVIDFWSLIRRFEKHGFDVQFLNPACSISDPSGRLMIGVLASMAEYELSVLRSRTQLGTDRAANAGKHMGSPAYGFEMQEGFLKLCSVEQSIIDLIRIKRKNGKSLRAIAQVLNDQKIPTKKKGKQWYASTVHAILKILSP